MSSEINSFHWNTYIMQLIELRKCVIQCGILLFVAFLILFWQDQKLYTFIAKPLLAELPSGGHMIATEITSTFMVPMKLAWVSALMIMMPYILYKVWNFVAPGLYKNEKKSIFPLLICSIGLFYTGLCFAYYIICPLALRFFTNSAPKGVSVMTDIRLYLDFVLTLLFASGLAFQVPVITKALIGAKLLTGKQLAYLRPYVIVGAFILGMLLTPPDVVSQILLALPMWGLFEVSLLFCAKREPRLESKDLVTKT